ncbi:MAG TPA: type IV pili twitching motility protein PilT [candidate division Zixibacteria bacterium]|nr:type IV pili twitching motility protein PilT [candidate division Zixibacteria bacterium]
MIETPTSVKSEQFLRKLLNEMVQRNATDMHISAESPPMLRIDGKLVRMPYPALSENLARMLALSLMSTAQRRKFEKDLDIDFSIGIRGLSRFRCNVFHQNQSIAMAVKAIPFETQTPEELNIPPEIYHFGRVNAGLVLIAGPRGSGKSTTQSAILKRLNEERQQHIITIEEPIEFVYSSSNCIVNQREVMRDTKSYEIALESTPRQDTNIVFVSETNEKDKLVSTLKIADMGLLVFATMRSRDAVSTVMRLVDLEIPHYLISGALRFVIAQRLLRVICPSCKRVVTPDFSLLREIGLDPEKVKNLKFHRGTGCPKCHGTGYKGRRPIFETLEVTPIMKAMLQAGTSVIELWRHAVNEGMVPLRKVALKMMLDGETTLEQVATETFSYQ